MDSTTYSKYSNIQMGQHNKAILITLGCNLYDVWDRPVNCLKLTLYSRPCGCTWDGNA